MHGDGAAADGADTGGGAAVVHRQAAAGGGDGVQKEAAAGHERAGCLGAEVHRLALLSDQHAGGGADTHERQDHVVAGRITHGSAVEVDVRPQARAIVVAVPGRDPVGEIQRGGSRTGAVGCGHRATRIQDQQKPGRASGRVDERRLIQMDGEHQRVSGGIAARGRNAHRGDRRRIVVDLVQLAAGIAGRPVPGRIADVRPVPEVQPQRAGPPEVTDPDLVAFATATRRLNHAPGTSSAGEIESGRVYPVDSLRELHRVSHGARIRGGGIESRYRLHMRRRGVAAPRGRGRWGPAGQGQQPARQHSARPTGQVADLQLAVPCRECVAQAAPVSPQAAPGAAPVRSGPASAPRPLAKRWACSGARRSPAPGGKPATNQGAGVSARTPWRVIAPRRRCHVARPAPLPGAGMSGRGRSPWPALAVPPR